MYSIKIDGQILHDYRLADDGLLVVSPTLTRELNTQETLTFSIPPGNPRYDYVSVRKSKIEVLENDEPVWWGRVLDKTKRLDGTLYVTCEGELAYLRDSILRPFGFKGSPQQLLADILAEHNAQVDSDEQFAIGTVTVTDPNNTIVRSSSYAMTSWEAICDKLVEMLGGYLRIRHVGAVKYLDYLADFVDGNNDPLTSNQTVEFGKNLLSLEDYATAEDVVTCLIPYGAQYDYDDPNYEEDAPEPISPDTIDFWHGNALGIESVTTGNVDYVKNSTGVYLWGEIWGTQTWDDVTIASNLKTKAESWLADQIREKLSLEITAADLSYIEVDVDKIMMGLYTRIVSKPHNIDTLMLCTGAVLHFDAPQNNMFYFGKSRNTLTAMVGRGLKV